MAGRARQVSEKRNPCPCGSAFVRGKCDGVQPTDRIGLELRTCPECGNTNSSPLHILPLVRRSQCLDLIVEVAARDDLCVDDRERRIRMLLDEMTKAARDRQVA